MNNYFKFIMVLSLGLFLNNAFSGYEKKEAGFYLNHYDQMKDLKDQACRYFLGSVYRGGAPLFDGTDHWIKKINTNKIKMVFDLRNEMNNAVLERDILLKNNIAYVKLPLKTSGLSQNEKMTIEVALPALDFKSSPTLSKTTMTNVEATSWKSEFIDYGGVMYKPLLKLMMDVDKVRNARKL